MTPPVAGLSPRVSTRIVGPVNLHDWIDELCDALDLDAEVDATIECTLNDSGESYAVAITVTSVDEDTEQVLFDIEVAETAS